MTPAQLDALQPVSEELWAKIEPIVAPFIMKHVQINIHRGQWPGMENFRVDGMTEEQNAKFQAASDAWIQAGRPLCLVAAEVYEDLVLMYDCAHGHCILVDLDTKQVQATAQPGFLFTVRNLAVIDKYQHEPPLKSSFFVSTHQPAHEAHVQPWYPAQHDHGSGGTVETVTGTIH